MNSHNTPITSLSVTIAPSQDREDTTEVAQLRAVLTQLEARWSATFDQVAVGIAHIALDGHCLWINQRLCSILGYRAEELASKTIAALIVPEDWNNNVKAAQQLIAGETQSYLLNERYRHKNGSTIWGRRTLSLARTSEGTPDYFIAVIEDITALKLAEDALRASEERYRRVVNDQADLICRFRPDFCLTFVNQAYAESVGKTPAELIGSNVLDLIPLEHQADVINHLPIQNPTGHAATMENPIWSADGALRWFEWTDRAIVDEQGAVIEYQAVGRDITARRQAEEAERRQRQFTEALLGSLAALTTSLDVEQVMPHILASATTVVPSDAGSIILFEEGYYRIAYCRGFSPEVATLLQQQRFAIDTWPNIRATLTHKMAYIAVDTQQTAEWGGVSTNGMDSFFDWRAHYSGGGDDWAFDCRQRHPQLFQYSRRG